MNAQEHIPVVKINEDYCSRCSICYSACHFEAISRDPETGEVKIDLKKCQVCGLCYSACPATAIGIVYYNYESLLDYVKTKKAEINSNTLILMCRGNSPSSGEIDELLESERVKIGNYIPLRVPCVGRVPADFILGVLDSGINKIVAVQCEEEFCRFKYGSKVNLIRLSLVRMLLDNLGFEDDALRIIKYARKVVYETDKCVGCDKCVFICPYDAIEAEPLSTPKILQEKCVGCGACALVCPHSAIEVKGFEFENLYGLIQRFGEVAKQMKTRGTSPVILIFCCQWSEFSALDHLNEGFFDRKSLVIEIPCFKSLDPFHVVYALHTGFDAVFALVCSPEDCRLEKGRETAERNTDVLKRTLEKMNLKDRFEIHTISPRDVGEFNKKIDIFYKRIAALPPIKLEASPPLKTKS